MGASAQVDRCDANGDGEVDIADVTYVVDHILGRGHASAPVMEAIDLGLPSGTKWASCNIGAMKPEEYGGYYAWGETEEKEVYNQSTYKYYRNGSFVNLGSDISDTEYDVAHVKWGGKWCMPTCDDFKELLDYCTSEWTTLNGVKGRKFISKINSNSIFLPATGYRKSSDFNGAGEGGCYWSSVQHPDYGSNAYYFYFDSGSANWGYDYRFNSQCVRPVEKPKAEAVYLGLPSGTKWASYNVGATKPEEFGEYYAWGETKEKDVYNWRTYIHCDGTYDTCHDLGSNISGTKYDVAHVKWGGNWCMPTEDDIRELYENCTVEWTTLNGVNGKKFTSKINGNSFFLPAAGHYQENGFHYAGERGYFWSSTPSLDPNFLACNLNIVPGYDNWGSIVRYYGQTVRPVKKPKANEVPAEAIDLGLPSGTKWASCNVGATRTEEYGGYYAWGETKEKDTYTWENYIHCDGTYDTCHDFCEDITGTEYDVAHLKWGGNWYMPTWNDIKELLDYCDVEWTTLNGVNGKKFTSKINGNSIFLPAAGYRWDGDLKYAVETGDYWSSTKVSGGQSAVHYLHFYSGTIYPNMASQYVYGRTVRPIAR